jgi:hypothetical protein
MRLIRWISDFWLQLWREFRIPAPPFRASKRTKVIMYGLWYGKLSPDQARKQAGEWGFPPQAIEEMIVEATQSPSYWSPQATGGNVSVKHESAGDQPLA